MLLVVGAIYFFFTPGTPSTSDTASTTPENVEVATPTTGATAPKTPTSASAPTKTAPKNNTAITSIFKQSGSHSCEYEVLSGNTRTSNVIYIADGKMRGEFRTTAVGNSSATIMVFDGINLYTWPEGRAVGTKTKLTSLSQIPVTIPNDLTSASVVELGKDNTASWNCHTWLKDAALLKAPSYVKFY